MKAPAVVLLALAFAAPALAAPPNAADLEAKIVCPVCETTLDQSNAPVAERMKLFIRERIAAGDTEQQITDALVSEFGPGVLATPRKGGFGLLAWALPLVVLAGGAVAVTVLARTWARGRNDGEAVVPVDLERRVDEELARFDA